MKISDEKAKEWMKGENLEIDEEFGSTYVIVKNGDDVLGNGQNTKEVIKNYVPKERRVR